MALRTEVRADRSERGQETLHMTGGLEAPQRPFALPHRLMRIFRPIVQPLVLAMFDARQDILLGGTVAGELVRNDDLRHILAALQHFAKNFLAARLFRRLWTRISSTFPC